MWDCKRIETVSDITMEHITIVNQVLTAMAKAAPFNAALLNCCKALDASVGIDTDPSGSVTIEIKREV